MPIGMSDEESMMPSLYDFFNIDCNFEIIKEFINSRKSRTNKLSFGLLDWFNVNYAKEYGVEYTLTRMGKERSVYVWQAYNAALDGYGKERFDPFARGKSRGGAITLANEKGESVTSTLRQLNYFRWAIENGVIAYVKEHIDDIYEDFTSRSNRGSKKQQGTKKEKLSVSASKSLGIHNVKMTVKFTKKT
jgi:hypothetical protein